jgi:hypothetical protein
VDRYITKTIPFSSVLTILAQTFPTYLAPIFPVYLLLTLPKYLAHETGDVGSTDT